MDTETMNRRDFLKTLGLVAPVAVVAPTYFFAPKGGWPFGELTWATNNTQRLKWRHLTTEDIMLDFQRNQAGAAMIPERILFGTGHELDSLAYVAGIERTPGLYKFPELTAIKQPETDQEFRKRLLARIEDLTI